MNQHSPLDYDVIILGAGAAGLFCAETAAKRGRRVLILEKANKIGKKNLDVRRRPLQFHQSICGIG